MCVQKLATFDQHPVGMGNPTTIDVPTTYNVKLRVLFIVMEYLQSYYQKCLEQLKSPSSKDYNFNLIFY